MVLVHSGCHLKMDLSNSARLCRLCLCSSKRFIDVMEENGDLGFVAAKTIEDLLQLKVQKVGNYPWLACSTCLEKLIDFKLFKSRCVDSLVTFEKRFCPSYLRKIRPQNDEKLEPNERGTLIEENGWEDEVGATNVCQVLMQEKAPDNLASGSIWHKYEDENVKMVPLDTCSNAGLKSSEINPDDQRGDMDIEEGDIVKEEPQDTDEIGSPLGQGRSLEIKDEPQDMEGNDSTIPPQVPGICQIDSVLSNANMSMNSHSVDPHESNNEGNEMVAPVENRAMASKEESAIELKEGNHHIVEGFYCVFCTAVLDTEKNLRDHIAKHEEGRWRNQIVSKCPTIRRNVGAHPIALVNSSPLNLSMNAGGNSKKLQPLPNSMYFHRKYESIKCKKCFRAFSSYEILKRHRGSCNPKFECSRCKKTFGSKYYLLGHLKVGKSNEVFSCPKCSKSFDYKCELKAHKQVHYKVFICKDCQCVFDRYYSLKEHILTHCKVKPLVCKDCQGTFIGSHSLRKHRIEAHNGRAISRT